MFAKPLLLGFPCELCSADGDYSGEGNGARCITACTVLRLTINVWKKTPTFAELISTLKIYTLASCFKVGHCNRFDIEKLSKTFVNVQIFYLIYLMYWT